MTTSKTKLLPKSIRFGGTPLPKYQLTGEAPEADGVRRVNDRCVELESYANLVQSGSASFIGLYCVTGIAAMILASIVAGSENITYGFVVNCVACILLMVLIAFLFYFASGAHRTRGAYIRIHRGTRKLYFVYPRRKKLHVIDWDQLEALAGYVPIASASGYSSRHPLYLIGVDRSMEPPTEICVACGNLGIFDGDRSAKALWSYLQVFIERGPEDLPQPAPLLPRMSRRQATLQPYREWFAGLRRRLREPDGALLAPITIPLCICWLFIAVFPESVEIFLQYNVPYAQFPKEIDRLCGFDEKRKPVIRVNGERIDM